MVTLVLHQSFYNKGKKICNVIFLHFVHKVFQINFFCSKIHFKGKNLQTSFAGNLFPMLSQRKGFVKEMGRADAETSVTSSELGMSNL